MVKLICHLNNIKKTDRQAAGYNLTALPPQTGSAARDANLDFISTSAHPVIIGWAFFIRDLTGAEQSYIIIGIGRLYFENVLAGWNHVDFFR
jgi:hypothetical protein